MVRPLELCLSMHCSATGESAPVLGQQNLTQTVWAKKKQRDISLQQLVHHTPQDFNLADPAHTTNTESAWKFLLLIPLRQRH